MTNEILGNLLDPLDDPDIGYGDEEEFAGPAPPINLARVMTTIRSVQARPQPSAPEKFGEVSDPDEDSYPDPNDLYGSGNEPDDEAD